MARLDSIFELRYGHSLELNALTKVKPPNGVNFVGRAMGNNGVTARVVTDVEPAAPGALSVALGGNGVLSTFVQPEPFVCGRDVMILTSRDPLMSVPEKLFWARCIWANRYRFSYGRQANRTLGSLEVPDSPSEWLAKVTVPTNENLEASIDPAVPFGEPMTWTDFQLGDLFEIRKGRRFTKADRTPGTTRFIGASEKNNGVTDMVDLKPIFEAGCVTIPYNGNSVGCAFYQDEPFFACDDVNVLIPPDEPPDKFALLFLCAMIRHERQRFTYGYKWTLERMKGSTVRLPATAGGDPDWQRMSRIARGLPFSAAIPVT